MQTNVVRQACRMANVTLLADKSTSRVDGRLQPVHLWSVARLASSGKARCVARSIVLYLAEHPEAKDSLEGMRWWIDRADECSDADISEAIRMLLERGLLSRWDAAPGSVVYGLSEDFVVHPKRALREFDAQETKHTQ